MDVLLGVGSIVGIIGAVIFVLWQLLVWWIRNDTLMHDLYCTCSVCDQKRISDEISRREWYKRGDEIRRAVDEISRR